MKLKENSKDTVPGSNIRNKIRSSKTTEENSANKTKESLQEILIIQMLKKQKPYEEKYWNRKKYCKDFWMYKKYEKLRRKTWKKLRNRYTRAFAERNNINTQLKKKKHSYDGIHDFWFKSSCLSTIDELRIGEKYLFTR